MRHLDEKIATAESRIKELELLIEHWKKQNENNTKDNCCLLYTSPSQRDLSTSRMPSSA